jgi:phenylalanine ammonia-lyase
MLIASYLYTLCQALDLRAMQHEFNLELQAIVHEELSSSFSQYLSAPDSELDFVISSLHKTCMKPMLETLDTTSTMDAEARMIKVASTCTIPLVEYFTSGAGSISSVSMMAVKEISSFRSRVASRAWKAMEDSRRRYLLDPESNPIPAAAYLNKTKPVYVFVRETLKVRMHGRENLGRFENGLGATEEHGNVGGSVAVIHEAIRDGRMGAVVGGLFA